MLGRGAAGQNGVVLAQSSGAGDPVDFSYTLSDANLQDLNAGLLYVLIQSADHSAGAVRGQLVANGGGECVVVYDESTEEETVPDSGEETPAGTTPEDGAGAASDALLLWNGETPFSSSNGSPTSVDVYAGATAFEGVPTPWHSPAVQLIGLDSFRVNLESYDEIRFYAKADKAGRTFDMSVSSWPVSSKTVDISGFIQGGALDEQWRLVRIPVAELENGIGALAKVDTLHFGKAKPQAGHHIFIDEVWAVNLAGEATENPDVDPEEVPAADFDEPEYHEALTLFDAEGLFTSFNGAPVLGDVAEGNASFEGVPTTWHKPTVLLVDQPSYRANISQFDEVWFYAKADQLGKNFSMTLQGWPQKSASVPVADYIEGGALDTQWRLVRIPVAAFQTESFALEAIDTLNLGVAMPSTGHHIFIDNVRAIKLNP